MNKKKYFLIILFLLSNISLADNKTKGTASATELLIPVNAYGLSMSDADITNISGMNAIFYNPAGLINSENNIEAMFSYMNYIADIGFSYAAVSFGIDKIGTFALSVRNLDFGDIPVTTVELPYGTGDFFSPTYVTVGLSYAFNLSDNLSFGTSINLITEKIMQTNALALGFDFGLMYSNLFKITGLKLGAVLKNLGTPIKFDGVDLLNNENPQDESAVDFIKYDTPEFELPLKVELGLSYSNIVADQYGFNVAFSYKNSEYLSDEYSSGLELGYDELVFLRMGYSYNSSLDDNESYVFGPTFGIGLTITSVFEVSIDYGYRKAAFFNHNHMMTINIGF